MGKETEGNKDWAQEAEGALPAQVFGGMLEAIPWGGDAGETFFIDALANAGDLAGLEAPWEATNWGDMEGVPVLVRSLKRMPSDKGGGFGIYLIAEAEDLETGDGLTLVTGSNAVVAQLVRAHALGLLPVRCALVKGQPTKQGTIPQRLTFKV